MRFGIEASPLRWETDGGIKRICQHMLPELVRLLGPDHDIEYILDGDLPASVHLDRDVHTITGSRFHYLTRGLAHLTSKRSYDAVLVLSPFCCGVRVPVLQLLYDLYPLRYPRMLPLTVAADGRYWIEWTGALVRALAAQRCRTVIAISADTAAAFQRLHVYESCEVVVAHLGSSLAASVTEEGIRPEIARLSRMRFLLYVGAFNIHKNVQQVIRVFEALATRHLDLQLVLVGHENWPWIRDFKSLINSPRIHVLSGCSDSELATLYRSCGCFVYLSRYEGFGLPVLEAMSCGAPVVVSSEGALPEVVGHAGYLVKPHRRQSIVDAVEASLQPAANAMLRERSLRRSADFNWTSMAGTVAEAMLAAASSPGR